MSGVRKPSMKKVEGKEVRGVKEPELGIGQRAVASWR